MSDPTLAVLRASLADRVTAYWLRADLEGPDSHRDAQCASYVALLAIAEAEVARRTRARRRLFAAGRLGRAAEAELPEYALQDDGDVHHLFAVPGVDVAHTVIVCEEVAR